MLHVSGDWATESSNPEHQDRSVGRDSHLTMAHAKCASYLHRGRQPHGRTSTRNVRRGLPPDSTTTQRITNDGDGFEHHAWRHPPDSAFGVRSPTRAHSWRRFAPIPHVELRRAGHPDLAERLSAPCGNDVQKRELADPAITYLIAGESDARISSSRRLRASRAPVGVDFYVLSDPRHRRAGADGRLRRARRRGGGTLAASSAHAFMSACAMPVP